MSCTNCSAGLAGLPCSCASSCLSGCDNSSCCDNTVQGTQTPFYACAEACEESHCQQIVVPQFNAVLKVSNSWNIPDCGELAVLVIANLQSILIDSYLWHSVYGYFRVTAFEQSTGQVTIINDCNAGNADPGTAVPACTSFVVAPVPDNVQSGSTSLFPFLLVDFTAPAVSSCILITVTNVNGLSVGKNVQISSGTYRIQAIPNADNVEICNDGTGITPGTTVEAQNAAGELQYPLTLIDANSCTNSPVLDGSLVVCKDGIQQPLDGSILGSIPVLTDIADNLVQFQSLELPTRTCTSLTACLVLTSGSAGPYTLIVVDSSAFMIGDLIQIGSRTDRFTVTGIPDGTTITATVAPVPGANETIPPGTSVCLAACCEIVAQDLQDLLDEFGGSLTPCSDFENEIVSQDTGIELPASGLLDSVLDKITFTGAERTINNDSTCRVMHVHWTAMLQCIGNVTIDGGRFRVALRLFKVIGGSQLELLSIDEDILQSTTDPFKSFHMTGAGVFTIPAASSETLQVIGEIEVLAAPGAKEFSVTQLQIFLEHFGVAV